MEMLRDIITSNGGAFAVVFAVLWAVGYSLLKFSEWKIRAEDATKKGDKLESKIETIMSDLSFIKGTLDVVNASIESLNQANYIIKGTLESIRNGSPSALTQAHSPISLTLKGQEVAKEMRIHDMIARNWEKIESAIDAKVAFKNAYDIQQFCIEKAMVSLETFFAQSDIDAIKMFAYNNGQPLAFYGSMIGVIIRDKYFEIKKIPIDKVDETDPNK